MKVHQIYGRLEEINIPFEKGQSGNAQGRPKQTQEQKDQKAEFQVLLRQATVPALKSIIALARDRRSKNCYNACKYIIDKAYGSDAELLSDDDEPMTIRIVRYSQVNNNDSEKDDADDWELATTES